MPGSRCASKNARMSSRAPRSQNASSALAILMPVLKTRSFGSRVVQFDFTNDHARGRATGLSKKAAR